MTLGKLERGSMSEIHIPVIKERAWASLGKIDKYHPQHAGRLHVCMLQLLHCLVGPLLLCCFIFIFIIFIIIIILRLLLELTIF